MQAGLVDVGRINHDGTTERAGMIIASFLFFLQLSFKIGREWRVGTNRKIQFLNRHGAGCLYIFVVLVSSSRGLLAFVAVFVRLKSEQCPLLAGPAPCRGARREAGGEY